MGILFRIRHTLNNPEALCDIGPLIPGSFGATAKDTPSAAGTTRNVQGNLLFDTGAGRIFIDESVAVRLGLQQLPQKEDVHGLGGKQSVSLYQAFLFLPVEPVRKVEGVPANATFLIGFSLPMHGIPGIQTNHEAHGKKATNGLPVIGVIGRSFLQFTKFVYDGLSGNLVIEIDESIQKPKP